MKRIAIYGIFDKQGICLYVGQTCDPIVRSKLQTGIRVPGCKPAAYPGMEFRILRWTTLRHANRLEKQVIAGYKRRGQAQGNKRIVGAAHYFGGKRVWVQGYKRVFRSVKLAHKAIGCADSTLIRALKMKNGWVLNKRWQHVKVRYADK